MATAGQPAQTQKSMSIEIDGQRVPLNPAGLERAQRDDGEAGKKIVEAVRAAFDRAS